MGASEHEHLAHRPFQQAACLHLPAQHPHRHAGDRSHPTKWPNEQQLLPEGSTDIRSNARLFGGMLKDRPQVIAAPAGLGVEFANGEKGSGKDGTNVARIEAGAMESTEAAQDAARSKGCRE